MPLGGAGRKPSNTHRTVGSPLTANAAVAALGPGMTLTGIPDSAAAATRR